MGLRRYLGQHESDVGLQVLSRSVSPPCSLVPSRKGQNKRRRVKRVETMKGLSVHQHQWP